MLDIPPPDIVCGEDGHANKIYNRLIIFPQEAQTKGTTMVQVQYQLTE